MEYTSGKLAAFLGGTISNTWTKRIDYYSYQTAVVTEDYAENNPNESETLSNFGWNVKAGANYNINENHNVFINAGAYSRVPFFRFHFLNYQNDVNPDLQNEKIYSFEFGYGFVAKKFRLNFNAYYSIWDDISQLAGFRTDEGQYINAFISDLKETHLGIELDAQYAINRWVNVGGLLAIGDWEYSNDPVADLYDDQTHEKIGEGTLYLKDLKVPDQPQTQVGLNANFTIAKQIDLGLQYLYYANMYAQYTLEDRTDPDVRAQAWKLPSYGVVNGRVAWRFQFAGLASQLQLNIYNMFDTVALAEAEDTAEEDNAGSTYYTFKKGYWIWGRNMNFSLKVNF